MRTIPAQLFAHLKSRSCHVVTGWTVTRQDGNVYGFTTADEEFVYGGVTYNPAGGVSPSAVVNKADASVDNLEVQVLISSIITDDDLRGGLWSNAAIAIFWINPDHPEWGIVPIRTGNLGEITIKSGQWTGQLRSLLQLLQQPLGVHFTLLCNAQLGDKRCGIQLFPHVWQANHDYQCGIKSDGSMGTIVKPSTPNDFWYVCQYTDINTSPREPTAPGQGLSANDDLGPEDTTQKSVGPSDDSLAYFTYRGGEVDVFGIRI